MTRFFDPPAAPWGDRTMTHDLREYRHRIRCSRHYADALGAVAFGCGVDAPDPPRRDNVIEAWCDAGHLRAVPDGPHGSGWDVRVEPADGAPWRFRVLAGQRVADADDAEHAVSTVRHLYAGRGWDEPAAEWWRAENKPSATRTEDGGTAPNPDPAAAAWWAESRLRGRAWGAAVEWAAEAIALARGISIPDAQAEVEAALARRPRLQLAV